MNIRILSAFAAILIGTSALASCANTIRGVGRDVANTADATQDAGRSVRHSVRHKHY